MTSGMASRGVELCHGKESGEGARMIRAPSLGVERGQKPATLSRRSLVLSGSSVSFQSRLPAFCRADLTWAGGARGFPALNSAAPPATCGDAIDVPEMVFRPP